MHIRKEKFDLRQSIHIVTVSCRYSSLSVSYRYAPKESPAGSFSGLWKCYHWAVPYEVVVEAPYPSLFAIVSEWSSVSYVRPCQCRKKEHEKEVSSQSQSNEHIEIHQKHLCKMNECSKEENERSEAMTNYKKDHKRIHVNPLTGNAN